MDGWRAFVKKVALSVSLTAEEFLDRLNCDFIPKKDPTE
jgi:hypothetical protein